MKIFILNGNPKSDNVEFDNYIDKLSDVLISEGKETVVLRLRNMKINYCTGCYNCWLKTPGVCTFKDDMQQILTEYLDSDLVVFASPVIMGFISSLLKRVQERCLPLLHPFLCINNDRMQHVLRYDKYPSIALLLDRSEKFDAEYSEIIEKAFRSNTHWKFLFSKTMDASPEEVAYEVNGI